MRAPAKRRPALTPLPARDRAFELEQLAKFPPTRVEQLGGANVPDLRDSHRIEPQGVPLDAGHDGCRWVPARRRR